MATEAHDPRHLFNRLVETAPKIQATQAFDDREIAQSIRLVDIALVNTDRPKQIICIPIISPRDWLGLTHLCR